MAANWFRGGTPAEGEPQPPGYQGRGPDGPTSFQNDIRNLVNALGAAQVNTNTTMGMLANNLGSMAQTTNQHLQWLAQTYQQGSGTGGGGDRGDG